METNQFFSMPRFGHLLRRELAQNKRNMLLVAAVMFLILLVNALVWAYERDNEFHEVFYPFFLFGGGAILTSLAFMEMNKPDGKLFYLTLPASNAEKYFSKWLLTGLGYAIVFTIGYWLFSFVADGLAKSIFDFNLGSPIFEHSINNKGENVYNQIGMQSFSPFSWENRLFFQIYIALNSLVLLGAVYYRKFAIFKTALTTTLFLTVFAALCLVLFRVIMYDLFDGLIYFSPEMAINGKEVAVEPSRSSVQFLKNNGESYLKFIGLWVIPTVLLVAGYFKMKETEL